MGIAREGRHIVQKLVNGIGPPPGTHRGHNHEVRQSVGALDLWNSLLPVLKPSILVPHFRWMWLVFSCQPLARAG